jgi:hypothetical protein
MFVEYFYSIAFFVGIIFFITAFMLGYDWRKAVFFLIGIIVANVPGISFNAKFLYIKVLMERMVEKVTNILFWASFLLLALVKFNGTFQTFGEIR